jgi:hypothetical protein
MEGTQGQKIVIEISELPSSVTTIPCTSGSSFLAQGSGGDRSTSEPTRTGQTDAWAEELDRLLAGEFQGTRAIQRGFYDRETTLGTREWAAVSRPSQEDRFYLHSLQIQGQPVEFAVSLQATSECEPRTILRLLKQSHVLDPACQHGRRPYVLVHCRVPLLTRR